MFKSVHFCGLKNNLPCPNLYGPVLELMKCAKANFILTYTEKANYFSW